ncbi:MAG: hypothetical protein QW075_02990 [Thermofilaceae archaeon]
MFGLILIVVGLGSGVYEWIMAGFLAPFPVLGLSMTLVGLYLLIDGLRRRRPRTISREELTIGALLSAVVAGTIAMSELKRRAESGSVTQREIEEGLQQLELLRIQGKISPEKYREYKAILESAKR